MRSPSWRGWLRSELGAGGVHSSDGHQDEAASEGMSSRCLAASLRLSDKNESCLERKEGTSSGKSSFILCFLWA